VRPARGREKRWVVREGDGATVAEIVARAGEGPSAIDEGRVFVGRARAKSAGQAVRVGDEVRIGAGAAAGAGAGAAAGARAAAGAGAGGGAWAVIWERDGMIACNKPAGMPTVPDHGGASHSLVVLAAKSIGLEVADMRVTSRLDREVSGVVIFATTAEAEARLRGAREQGRYARRYVAIAAASGNTLINVDRVDQRDQVDQLDQLDQPDRLDQADQPRCWDAPIGAGKDARHRAAFGADAKEARTHWRAVARVPGYALLAVEPQTGRTHQIRVHASHAGAPLLGDRDYGGAARVTLPGGRTVSLARIALHAARVSVPDASGAPLVAAAPIPVALTRAWTELGGAAEAWDMAMSCELDP
jgi:23S rRNA pseudouridine1911/1915/1917 synthase